MSVSNSVLSQKEYLKKYLSCNDEVKKKKKKKTTSLSNIKRSKIVDDDIDLKSMRTLDDDEVDLYQMDEEGPQVAGIVDERPAEVKAQEYYNSKRWKVFGGEDGVRIVDNFDESHSRCSSKLLKSAEAESNSLNENKQILKLENHSKNVSGSKDRNILYKNKMSHSSDSDISLPRKGSLSSKKNSSSKNKYDSSDSDHSFNNKKNHSSRKDDSVLSPSRKNDKRTKYDSDASPPRRQNINNKNCSDSDTSLPKRRSPQRSSKKIRKTKNRSDSDNSPPRKNKIKESKYKNDSDNSPPRKGKESSNKTKFSDGKSHSMKEDKYEIGKNNYVRKDTKLIKSTPHSSSDSDNSPPRRGRKTSSTGHRKRVSRSNTPPLRTNPFQSQSLNKNSSRLSRKDLANEQNVKRHFSDSDDSPPRRKNHQSPPRKLSSLKEEKPLKKSLYKPNDSSSDEASRSKKKKMKTTLDGKRAGLQDAKELKKELSNFKLKEDLIFSKMDASVSGIGAAPVKRDRKTGQVRDMEKEKEAQKEKEAKASVVNEKYYKWGKGLKQVEDAAERKAEVMKEMNKPLARYAGDKDLDDYLKAQEREGDPMLDYIKQKQSEATPLTGAKPIYQGSFNPNRFGIRPGHRWDGVVRSSGYEKEWFTHQNARKARDEEAYKWSTSDM